MDTESASQKGGNVTADGKLGPSKYALLESYRNKKIGRIFRVDLRSPGGVAVLDWLHMDREELRHLLKRLGVDPETTRYQVDFLKSDDPLAVGYYQLIGIKPLPFSKEVAKSDPFSCLQIAPDKDLSESTLDDFIYEYAKTQWREIGTELKTASAKPNGGGNYMAAFHITRRDGVIIIATSWVEDPSQTKIVAS